MPRTADRGLLAGRDRPSREHARSARFRRLDPPTPPSLFGRKAYVETPRSPPPAPVSTSRSRFATRRRTANVTRFGVSLADGGHDRRPTDTAGGPAQLSARRHGIRSCAPREPDRDARALRPPIIVAGIGDRLRRRLARVQPRAPADRGRRVRRPRRERSGHRLAQRQLRLTAAELPVRSLERQERALPAERRSQTRTCSVSARR